MARGIVTNLLLQTDTDPRVASSWTGTGGLSASAAFAGLLPDNLTAAWTLTDSNVNTTHYFAQPVSGLVPGKWYFASIYASIVGGTISWIEIAANTGQNNAVVSGNLSTGANGIAGIISPSKWMAATSIAGWYRLGYIFQQGAAANNQVQVYFASADGSVVYAGGANQIAFGGMMVEEAVPGQLTPSPYYASGAASGIGPRDYGENWLQQAENQSKSPWAATQLTPTGGAALSPGGTQTATSLIPSGVNGAHYISQPVALTSYTGPTAFRARVKASGYSWCRLQLLSGASTNTAVYYNLGTGAVGTTSVGAGATLIGTPLAIPVPGYSGWYDLFFSASSTSGWQTAYLAVTIDGAGSAFSGDGVSGILSWGTQLARTNQMPDYRKTTSGIWVPSGAPRLAVL